MAKKKIELVYREGKPVAVILDIEEYKQMLEKLEDAADLRMLREMKKRKLHFRKFDEFMSSRSGTGCGGSV